MTTLAEARELVYQRFTTQWGTTTPFTFENEALTEPADAPWVRLTVRNLVRGQETLGALGNRRFRSPATVLMQVYTRANTGVGQGDLLAAQARDIFEAVSFSGLDFNNGMVRETGPTGKWYQHVAEVQFDYDEIK